jgi:hypothetical protein
MEEHVQGKGKGTRSILAAHVEHIHLGLSAQRPIEVETVENDNLAMGLISAVKLFGSDGWRRAEDGGNDKEVMMVGGDNTQVSAVILVTHPLSYHQTLLLHNGGWAGMLPSGPWMRLHSWE